jgi:2'-5' RNA ligase
MKPVLPLLLALCGLAATGKADSTAGSDLSLNLFAVPSSAIVAEVARQSDTLAGLGMKTFYEKGHRVHATLYLTTYPADAVDSVQAAVEQIASDHSSFPLEVKGIEVTRSNWVFLQVVRTAQLQRLADEITLAAEPFRDHSVAPPKWMEQYPAKLPAFRRYGSPNVFMQFQPHLTLLADEKNSALADYRTKVQQQPPTATGSVVAIGVGIADSLGQITKTLATYPLQPAKR